MTKPIRVLLPDGESYRFAMKVGTMAEGKPFELVIPKKSDGDDVVVRVADRGIGVPAREVDTLFTPFGRTREASNRGIKGTGLGLYISRRIVEAFGGSLEYRPTPGGGATFEARFRRHVVAVG